MIVCIIEKFRVLVELLLFIFVCIVDGDGVMMVYEMECFEELIVNFFWCLLLFF